MEERKRKSQGNGVMIRNEQKRKKSTIVKYQKTTLERGTHPLGIQPLGNLYFCENLDENSNSRDRGLGIMRGLKDEIILEILGQLSANDLVNLSLTSKAFYVFCHQEDLWKELTVQRFAGNFTFTGTWKATYAFLMKGSSDDLAPRQSPLKIKDFYSDYLFQSWYCSSRQIDPAWLEIDNVERRSDLTLEEFLAGYERPNKPVVLKNAIKHWQALQLWNKDNLVKNFGEVIFRAEVVDIKLKDYFRYAEKTTDESPVYLFDRFFGDRAPELLRHFDVPIYFREDLFSLLGKDRPDYRWLLAGPARSGSTFHKDPNSTSAWNAVIKGKKKWILYPPHVIPPGVFPSHDGAEVTTSISLMEWFANFYPLTQEEDESRRPIECVVEEGDVMFIPNQWWHTVLNLEDAIAITQNYVSKSNLKNVLHFIKDCGAQVSGYHGEDNLYDKFVACLQEKRPELLDHVREEEEKEKERLAGKINAGVWEKLKNECGNPTPFTFAFGDDLETEEGAQ